MVKNNLFSFTFYIQISSKNSLWFFQHDRVYRSFIILYFSQLLQLIFNIEMFKKTPFLPILQLLQPLWPPCFYRRKSLLLAEWEFHEWDFPGIQWIFSFCLNQTFRSCRWNQYWVHYSGTVKLRNNDSKVILSVQILESKLFYKFPDNFSRDKFRYMKDPHLYLSSSTFTCPSLLLTQKLNYLRIHWRLSTILKTSK